MNDRLLNDYLEFFREIGVAEIRTGPKPAAAPSRAASTARARTAEDPAVRKKTPEPAPDRTASPAGSESGRDSAAAMQGVRDDLGDCVRCKLHRYRTQIVFGTGNVNADLMFVGEAPGADEDRQGVPFVGRAGQLLTRIIEAIGLTREQVYIANIIKCRPPDNRNPEPDEIAHCSPFVLRQIALIQPRVICALGKFAAQTLLETQAPISQLRGKFFAGFGTKVMPTFHPSFLLRNPSAKREVWEDMKAIRRYLDSRS